jgi:hypothetical protein
MSKPRTKVQHQSSASTSSKGSRKRKKVGGGPNPIEHVKVYTAEGRIKWITRPREAVRK